MKTYKIRPLALSITEVDKPLLTYRCGFGVKLKVPNFFFYIEGAEKNVLVDTSTDAEQAKVTRGLSAENIMTFEQALASIGLKPENIDIVIQTHLHWDHCASTSKCKNAKVFIQEDELKFALSPHPIFALGYKRQFFENSRILTVNGHHEVLPGIELIPVPGHTPGTQAVAVHTEKGKAVISGFCSIRENFEPSESPCGALPVLISGIDVDPQKAYYSLLRVKGIADLIVPMHDTALLDIKSIP